MLYFLSSLDHKARGSMERYLKSLFVHNSDTYILEKPPMRKEGKKGNQLIVKGKFKIQI